MASSTRAGRYIQQPTGYRAFVPANLKISILRELPGSKRNRLFQYTAYMAMFRDDEEPIEQQSVETDQDVTLSR